MARLLVLWKSNNSFTRGSTQMKTYAVYEDLEKEKEYCIGIFNGTKHTKTLGPINSEDAAVSIIKDLCLDAQRFERSDSDQKELVCTYCDLNLTIDVVNNDKDA